MDQSQAHQTGPIPLDKRTKEYKQSQEKNMDETAHKLKVGFLHLHSPLFFAKKNWKEKIDTRTDKGPQGGKVEIEMIEEDGRPLKCIMRCEGHELFLPPTSVFSYAAEKAINKVPLIKPTTGVSANTSINAQVSGPHDHVFGGVGAGQTGLGKNVK